MHRLADRLPMRFWEKVSVVPSGCWLWIGCCDPGGYGQFWSRGPKLAHRIAYQALVGPVLPPLELDHLCRNRPCVRVDHLEIVTRAQNVHRGSGLTALNARKTHCLRGHPFDFINTYMRSDGKGRECRACHRHYAGIRRAKTAEANPKPA